MCMYNMHEDSSTYSHLPHVKNTEVREWLIDIKQLPTPYYAVSMFCF